MAKAKKIQKSANPSRDWRHINDAIDDIKNLERVAGYHRSQIEDLRRKAGFRDQGGVGSNFKGEHNNELTYSVGDMVKISYGVGAGLYIKTAAAQGDPLAAQVWAQLSTVLDQSNFI